MSDIRSFWRQGLKVYRKKVKPFVVELRWTILIVLGFIVFLIGCYGFNEMWDNDHTTDLFDVVYNAFLLFQLKFPAHVSPINPALQFARFAAPFLTFCTFYLIFASWVLDRVKLFLLGPMGGHVVICGMGYIGPVLARNFYDRGYDVVVIEKDPKNKDLEYFKTLGAIVIVGDATTTDILKKARVKKARFLFTVTGDDGVNSEIAINCRKLVEPGWWDGWRNIIQNNICNWLYECSIKQLRQAGFIVYQMVFGGTRRPLRCFVHIVDPNLSRLLRSKQCKTDGGSIKMEFFNIYSRAGELILTYPMPFLDQNSVNPPHILVVGMGRMGERLILQVFEKWNKKYSKGGKKICITILDQHATAKIDSLLIRHSGIEDSCRLDPIDMELMSSEFLVGDYLFNDKGEFDLSRAYICLDDESLGLSVALQLNRIMETHRVSREKQRSIPIVVRTKYSGGLSILLNKMKEEQPIFENIYAFPLVDKTCKENIVIDDPNDVLARAIQDVYIRYQQRVGNTPKTKPSMSDWDDLEEKYRISCRNQAKNIEESLKGIHCDIAFSIGKYKPFKFTEEEIDDIARIEHKRFVEERKDPIWKNDYNDENRMYLKSYDELDKKYTAYDRNFVSNMPVVLASIDLQIVRQEKQPEKAIERLESPVALPVVP